MRSLPMPPLDSATVLDRCTASIGSATLREKLTRSKALFEQNERLYAEHGTNGTLFDIGSDMTPLPLTSQEARGLYKKMLVRDPSPGRAFYDRLKMSTPARACPLCGHREVRTLDHYLSKKTFPTLSITPLNLVPACSDCNKDKLDRVADSEDEQTIHPYFDLWCDDPWLDCVVLESDTPAVGFLVAPPSSWSPVQARRAQVHFDKFGLGRLYALQAANEMSGMSHAWRERHTSEGSDGLRRELSATAISRARHAPNSWQAALYRALSQSDWFCRVGYDLL